MSDTFDHLRIIAKDTKDLPPQDRAIIAHAADELDELYRLLSQTQAQLIETQRHQIALNEQLLAARQRESDLTAKLNGTKPPLRMTISTGWMKVGFPS